MTKNKEIQVHFKGIAGVAANQKVYCFKWGKGAAVKYIQNHLDAIEKLLQEPEPETLAASVLWLTDLCNRLEAENHKLQEDLAGDQVYIEELREDLCRTEALLKVTNRKNATNEELLKERNDKLEEDLTTLTRQNWRRGK